MKFAKEAIVEAKKMEADILVLPAGYLFADNNDEFDRISKEMIGYAQSVGITFMFGIDREKKDIKKDWSEHVKNQSVPWFGIIWDDIKKESMVIRQRSISSNDQYLAPDSVCSEIIYITFNDQMIPILMCGEIFNERIKKTIMNYKEKIKIVIDMAHFGKGLRIWQPMSKFGNNGIASTCSTHVDKKGAVKYFFTSKGENISSDKIDKEIGWDPQIEMKLWDI